MSWQQASSLTSFVHIHQKEPRQSVGAKSEQLANAYSTKLSLRTAFSSHKLSSYQDGPQKWNQPQAPRKPFRLPVLIFYWLQCSNEVNNLQEVHIKEEKNETKSICFNTDVSNWSKVWSTTYQSPSLHTAFLSERNSWIYTYIYLNIDTQGENFSP